MEKHIQYVYHFQFPLNSVDVREEKITANHWLVTGELSEYNRKQANKLLKEHYPEYVI